MAEMQTFAEAKKQQRMCDGEGYRNMAPLCGGRSVKTIAGKQYCQRHIHRLKRDNPICIGCGDPIVGTGKVYNEGVACAECAD